MRTLVAPIAVALLVPLAGCGKKPFTEFVAKEGGFSVLMPGTPKEDRSSESGMKLTLYVTETWGAAYGAGYADLPPGNPGNLDGAVRGMADACNGRVISQQGQTVGTDGWLEFEIESGSPKGFAAGRVLIVGGRVYEVYVIGRKTRLADPETRSFIDSFRLTDRDSPWQSGGLPNRADAGRQPAVPGPAATVTPQPATPAPQPVP
ncbi:MAG: hypothetical protein JWO38_7227, partial [Gemmataceae bacterium]|nr:hypothetical protein [Gemmataceae bacterium]